MKKQSELTHKEAVKKALEMLGGKATLKQIYPVAIKLIGKNTKAASSHSIPRCGHWWFSTNWIAVAG